MKKAILLALTIMLSLSSFCQVFTIKSASLTRTFSDGSKKVYVATVSNREFITIKNNVIVYQTSNNTSSKSTFTLTKIVKVEGQRYTFLCDFKIEDGDLQTDNAVVIEGNFFILCTESTVTKYELSDNLSKKVQSLTTTLPKFSLE